MDDKVYIASQAVISSVADNLQDHWESLKLGKTNFHSLSGYPVAYVCDSIQKTRTDLKNLKEFRYVDDAVVLGYLAAKQCVEQYPGSLRGSQCSVIFGSSRGPTQSLEGAIKHYNSDQLMHPMTSPTTTSGHFATFVAQQLGLNGMACFVSSACTTGLHALGLGYSLVKSGLQNNVLVGASESANTNFTMSMLGRIKVCSKNLSSYPCKPTSPDRDGLVLGEGSSAVLLSNKKPEGEFGMLVKGYGAHTETATATGLSSEGLGLQDSMRISLEQAKLSPKDIDLVIGHGSGTKKGDLAELNAYSAFFQGDLPPLTFHKWMTGHMLSASSLFSAVMAFAYLKNQEIPSLPYIADPRVNDTQIKNRSINHIMVTALGFGGQSSAIVLSLP